jgi:hypothetical protein
MIETLEAEKFKLLNKIKSLE